MLFNGIFFNKLKNKEITNRNAKVQECINEVWTLALSRSTSSIVGEFFDSKELERFFSNNSIEIVEILRKIDPKIKSYDVIPITPIQWFQDEDKNIQNKDIFYIIPISSHKNRGKNKNNMHWICLKENLILNSGDSARNVIGMYKINNLNSLYKAVKLMNERSKNVCFCFNNWVNQWGLFLWTIINRKKLPIQYYEIFMKIKKSKLSFAKKFANSSFDILKINIE